MSSDGAPVVAVLGLAAAFAWLAFLPYDFEDPIACGFSWCSAEGP